MKKLTILLTTLLITTSMSVGAGWIKSDIGMLEIMKLDGAKIINTVAGGMGGHNNRILTTIYSNDGLYRCLDFLPMRTATITDCYLLGLDAPENKNSLNFFGN